MNIGAAIFLTILLLVCSLIGLGYSVSQSFILQNKLDQLSRDNENLDSLLATEQSKRIKAETQVTTLQKQVTDLAAILEQERYLRSQAEQKALDLEKKVQQTNVSEERIDHYAVATAQNSIGLVFLLVVLFQVGNWRRHVRRVLGILSHSGSTIRQEEILTIRVTRQQLKDYLRFQRMGGNRI